MFTFLRALDLRPIEWSEAVGLADSASPYVGQVLDEAFARATAVVVLMTPDEVAYLRPEYADGPEDSQSVPELQTRPNVLFEAGMALGRHPERTVLVEVGDVRPFSDIAGRHTVRLNNHVPPRQDLAQRLEKAGCAVNLNGTDWHSAGDFSPPPRPGGDLPLGRRIPSVPKRRAVDLDAKYHDQGGNRIGKLQIINHGTETALNVLPSVDADAALDLRAPEAIRKIPGSGRSVTIDVWNRAGSFGAGPCERAFDLTLVFETEAGDHQVQTVFLDVNG